MNENYGTYISEMEKEVVLLRHKGNSFVMIANILGSSEVNVEKVYKTAMAKLDLLETTLPEDTEHIFPCATIHEFVDQMGVGIKIAGRNELIEAIRLSYNCPKDLDSIKETFFPKLASHLKLPETLVSSRIYRTVKYTCRERQQPGTPSNIFYKKAELIDRHEISLKSFFLNAHECIIEL